MGELKALTLVSKKFKYKRGTFHQFVPGDISKTVFGEKLKLTFTVCTVSQIFGTYSHDFDQFGEMYKNLSVLFILASKQP